MEKQHVKLLVDMREQRSRVTDYLLKDDSVSIEYTSLSSGDYVFSPSAVCERKEAQDFVSSIVDRRIFSQVPKMKSEYETVVVIIEGNIYTTHSAIEPAALIGALSWLMVLEGISVVSTDGPEMTAALISTMARHAQHGLGYTISLRSGKPKDQNAIAQYLCEGLPAVGGAKAQDLLDHFKTARAVFNATIDQLCEVKGISRQTAQKIFDASRIEWKK